MSGGVVATVDTDRLRGGRALPQSADECKASSVARAVMLPPKHELPAGVRNNAVVPAACGA